MIAVDNKGNVLCFNKEGKEACWLLSLHRFMSCDNHALTLDASLILVQIWESRISGFVAQGATFGDVDGNGVLDVVLGTVTGTIWALRGDNGKQLDAFPVRTNGTIGPVRSGLTAYTALELFCCVVRCVHRQSVGTNSAGES